MKTKFKNRAVTLCLTAIVVLAIAVSGCSKASPVPPSDERTIPDTGDSSTTGPGVGDAASVDPQGGTPTKAGILPGIDESNYPLIDGSTANLPLMAGLYSEVCGVGMTEAESRVTANKTEAAWMNIAGADVDMVIAYEAPKAIMDEAKEAGVKSHPLGRDGLVFLTGADNPVDSLTQDQLRGIYSGAIKNWSEVGGRDEPITAYQRNEGSGSQTMFEKLVMKGEKAMKAPSELRPGSMGGLIESLNDFDGGGDAIGYSVYYYADLMYEAPNLKILSVDGVAPSVDTIAGGEYALTNDFYVAVNTKWEQDKDSPAVRIRDYLLSPAGADFMRSLSYVPIEQN